MKRAALALAVVVALALIFHTAVLTALGSYLVKAAPPQKADAIVVLAGDATGHRIVTAGNLVREGYAPKAIVSGPTWMYDVAECDLEIPFATRRGYPETYFVHFEHRAHSTQEEAEVIIPELHRIGAKTILLVTSDYHTRRAGRIFRRMGPDLNFIVIAALDPYFSPSGWWHNREGRKTFAIEWMKTIAEWVGL